MRFQTRAIHAGQSPEPMTGAVIPPLFQNVTHVMDHPGEKRGGAEGFDYARTVNPTRKALEQCLASLEGAKHCVAFSSGMAATGAVASLLQPGDHAVVSLHVYAGTHRYFSSYAKGVDVEFVETEDAAAVRSSIREQTKLVWVETPGNPLGTLSDVRAIANACKAAPSRPLLAVDSTMASPYCQQPLALGADIVVHSTTKYISGHLDVLGGAVMTSDDSVHEALFQYQNAAGPTPSPFDNWLTLRGVRTLAVRMRAHSENAAAAAAFLESHPAIDWVLYPGLPSHPQHELAKRQMSGFPGMVAFAVKGGQETAFRFLKALKLVLVAESLGGVQSLISHSATMTHAPLSEQERLAQGITGGVCRLSVGLEDPQDIIDDLAQALAQV